MANQKFLIVILVGFVFKISGLELILKFWQSQDTSVNLGSNIRVLDAE